VAGLILGSDKERGIPSWTMPDRFSPERSTKPLIGPRGLSRDKLYVIEPKVSEHPDLLRKLDLGIDYRSVTSRSPRGELIRSSLCQRSLNNII